MFQKIIYFIKYHNAVAIALSLVLALAFGAMAASENVRNAVIGEEIVTEQGIDNSAILTADLDNFDFRLTIRNVREEPGAQNYYVDYSYQTLAIQDNHWQPVLKEETLIVSKETLRGGDLGLYLAEELGEVIDYQLSYLKEVQKLEREKGQTYIVQTTTYTSLIGLILDTETKELPGYQPVIQPAEIITSPNEPIIQPEPQVIETQPEIQPIVQPEPQAPACTPNWSCTEWQPLAETIACGEIFTQNRTCSDLNNCETNEGKPAETQETTGAPCETPTPASE